MRNGLVERFIVALVGSSLLTGCFAPPGGRPAPGPAAPSALVARVQRALEGHEGDALAYGGLYEALALRFEAGAYDSTQEAAAVASRAADIVGLPGVLKEIVNDELNPLLGTPQPITPDLAAQAVAKLRALSAACREAAP